MKPLVFKDSLWILFFFLPLFLWGQNNKGSLFIIGGGVRSDNLIKKMIVASDLKADDYIVILPMASKAPLQEIDLLKKQIGRQVNNAVVAIDFDKTNLYDKDKIDSLSAAKLIYIVGGSQKKFMNIVCNTPVFTAIHYAYNNGSVVAGTSAGAAVMLTGQHKSDMKTRNFDNIRRDSVYTTDGLGLLPFHNIIDQHFIKRSRFNRLISVLADFPAHQVIGIDESTAVICRGNIAKVVGDSQVVVLASPVGLSDPRNNMVSFKNVDFSIYTAGDTFLLKE